MLFLSPNQQRQSTEGKNVTSRGLAYPKLTWGLPTLSFTTNSSWLPWGRVAMPLISPLMPIQHLSASAMMIYYEEALYQVYGPLPFYGSSNVRPL